MSSSFKPQTSSFRETVNFKRQRGSTLIIVLWIAFGLVSLTLYFASSMSFELHASDNRVAGLMAEQAIDGAARYVNYVLSSQLTNGTVPDPTTYLCEAVPIGESHFWLIGRGDSQTMADQLTFALVDEASKLNLNYATSNMLANLPTPPMSQDMLAGILDWRGTNSSGAYQSYYAMQRPAYQSKASAFETVDELRLVYGASMDVLVAEDANRNGVLDANENDDDHNGSLTPGVLEYFTVYTREPMTNSDGTVRVNASNLAVSAGGNRPTPTPPTEPVITMISTNLSTARATALLRALAGPAGQGGQAVRSRSPLDFYVNFHKAPMSLTLDEFTVIANQIAVTNGAYIYGRININTASATVLACLPGINGNTSLAQTLVSYRETNPDKLGSVAWVVEALGSNNTDVLNALKAKDCITTQSFQFSADIAAIGPHGRGYRRARYVFDTADGAPRILYRQDLSHLGWALGKQVRQTWLGEGAVAVR